MFIEFPEKVHEVIGFDALIQVYNLRMERTAAAVRGIPGSLEAIVTCALRERTRFATLRKRLAELASLIGNERQDVDECWLRQIVSLDRELHRNIQQIDKL